jgi:hypothetical protein
MISNARVVRGIIWSASPSFTFIRDRGKDLSLEIDVLPLNRKDFAGAGRPCKNQELQCIGAQLPIVERSLRHIKFPRGLFRDPKFSADLTKGFALGTSGTQSFAICTAIPRAGGLVFVQLGDERRHLLIG